MSCSGADEGCAFPNLRSRSLTSSRPRVKPSNVRFVDLITCCDLSQAMTKALTTKGRITTQIEMRELMSDFNGATSAVRNALPVLCIAHNAWEYVQVQLQP